MRGGGEKRFCYHLCGNITAYECFPSIMPTGPYKSANDVVFYVANTSVKGIGNVEGMSEVNSDSRGLVQLAARGQSPIAS